MPSERYLTKSRFKLALECPTKLFYAGRPAEYANQNAGSAFQQALADGGFQVGALAKLMFPDGREVKAERHTESVTETNSLLDSESATLFEAAVRFGNLFARIDILRKQGLSVELIEVKAKSFDSRSFGGFRGARGEIQASWLPYLRDLAFQRYIFGLAYPQFKVRCFLMLPDKAKTCTVDGLNQRFRVRNSGGRPEVLTVTNAGDCTTVDPILALVNVDSLVDQVLLEEIRVPGFAGTLAELATQWGASYQRDERIAPSVGAQCSKCEFRQPDPNEDLADGRQECWGEAVGLDPADFARGTVLDIWNFRGKQRLIDRGIYRLEDVPVESLGPVDQANGLSPGSRRAMQVTGKWPGRSDFYIDSTLLKREMEQWIFPLHFIDFETVRMAIPYFRGQHPYSIVAYQFSHHVMEADGKVEHRTQFLSAEASRSSNFDFLCALQNALGTTGSVLMWSSHERTTLRAVLEELNCEPNPPTSTKGLSAFVETLIGSRPDSRGLIDLCQLAERLFYHPATKGSSSIKKVLPAVMQSSEFLRRRYSNPIYGIGGDIKSLNFVAQTWWQSVDGIVLDPYRLLVDRATFSSTSTLDDSESVESLELADGGAAMVAYARLQYEEMTDEDRAKTKNDLLRYCELDTLAMVMVVQAWRDWIL